jgi:hypothetical protein
VSAVLSSGFADRLTSPQFQQRIALTASCTVTAIGAGVLIAWLAGDRWIAAALGGGVTM